MVDSVNRARIAKLFGGAFAFAFHSAVDLLTYRDRPVRIMIDGAYDEIAPISTVAIANGRYFGGGMQVAPGAATDDGLFDVVIMGGAPKIAGAGRHEADLHRRAYRQALTCACCADARSWPFRSRKHAVNPC